jgi:hypothetical protein
MCWIKRAIRGLLRIPVPRITAEQALQITLGEMQERGQRLIETQVDCRRPGPVVYEGVRTWRVLLDPDAVPTRVAKIDNQIGEVTDYSIPPR